jgi:NADH dehydrogenase/NADH:ubiquinone oxidoreductase subunit G
MALDYRAKYKEMRAQLIKSSDLAFRLGYEQGMKDAQVENMQMQMQQQAEQAAQQAAMMQGGQPGQEGEPMSEEEAAMQEQGGAPQDEQDMEQAPMEDEQEMVQGQGTELDNHINELESLVAKGQKPTVTDLRKAVEALSDLRKNQKSKMKANKPAVASAQKKLVDNILGKWERESKMTAENLEELIATEGLKL